MNKNITLSSNKYLDHIAFWTAQSDKAEDRFILSGQRWSPEKKELDEIAIPLPKDVWALLRKISRGKDTELFVLLTVIVNILLSRYSGRTVITLHTPPCVPDDGAEGPAQDDHFANRLIPLLIELDPALSLKDILVRANKLILGSYACQAYPLSRLPENILERLSSNVWMEMEGFHQRPAAEEGTDRLEGYDLYFRILPDEQENGLKNISVQYNTSLFDAGFMARLADHFANIARSLGSLDKMMKEVDILSAAERQVLLEEFTRTDCGYPAGETVDGLFREQALVRGSSVAVTDGVRSWSYGELDRESDLLAGYLVGECGVRRGEVVGLLLSRGGSYVVSVLSVLKAGGVWLPLDPEHPSGRLEGVLSDAGAVAVVSDSEHLYRVPGYGGRLVALDVEWPQIAAGGGWREAVSGPQDGAYVLYTSGSTGRPKGVLVRHGSLLNTQRWRRDFYGFDQSYVTLQVASFGFDSSVNDIFSMLLWGGRVVVAGERDRLDAERLGELVAEHGVTNFNMVPGLYRGVLEGLSGSGGSLRVITLAGEKLSGGLVREHFRRSPGVTLVNEYGPTENAICSTALRIAGPLAGDPGIGRPVSNTRVYILDRELGLLPVGVVGEICLSGAGLSEGYIGSAALGEERFVAHPYEGSGLLYRTGDLGRWTPSGEVEYVGRLDDQVKIRGQRVEPGEVGSVLESAPGVSAAVVVAEGQEEKSLCGYVVLSSGGDLSAVEAYAAGHLPEYMRPRWYVVLESLPLTVNGKVDRSRLVRPQEEPAGWGPEQAARGPLEELVCGIWAGVLGRERVGAQEDFFRIGGDSIKAIQIASRLYRSGYKAGVKDIFEHPSVRELSGVLVLSDRRIDQSAVSGRVELTPIQRYFFGRSLPVPGHYNQSVMLFRAEGFERAMVESVFGYLVGHHDALRLVFRERGGVWEQYNRGLGEGVGVSVTEYDLRSEGSGEWPLSVSRLGGELQAGLDLSGGPLVKVGLFHRPGGDELLVVIHHLVVDTVSWRILLEDLEELLGQWESGQPLGLGDKTDSYRSWSEALLSYGSGAAQSERSYWSGVCAGWPAGLPKDHPGGANRLDTMEQVGFRLSAEQTRQLLEESHGAFHTEINDLLLAGLGLGLSRQYGVDRVGLWLEGHGRQELGLELSTGRTVGWFTSMYPVLLPVGGGTLSRCIREVKESLHGVPHKGIGYGSLRYGPGGSSLEALREISFNYLGQFDSDTANKRFGISEVSGGPERPGSEEREFALEVSGMVTGGCLRMWISYSREQYSRAGMERLSELYAESLGEVIGYCSSRRTAELTPSDLSYKGLTIDQLEKLSGRYGLQDVYPLTPMQEGLLFHSLYDRGSSAYFEQVSYRLEGELSPELVERSLQALFDRHEVLRTAFVHEGLDRPLQVLLRERSADFRYEDLRAEPVRERQERVSSYKEADRRRSFDLGGEALLRVCLFRLGEREYEFIWSHHHIIMDGWCVVVLTEEYFEIYASLREGRAARLGAVRRYRDYIMWLERQGRESAGAYWRAYLSGYGVSAVVPYREPYGESAGEYESIRSSYALSEELSEGLRELAASRGVTLNTVVQALWAILLGKYNGLEDVVFGSVVSGRPAELPEVESMIGLFINTIPVRIRYTGDMGFGTLLARMQQEALSSSAHQYYPLASIQSESGLSQQLLDHFLVFTNYPVAEQIEGLQGAEGSGESSGAADWEISGAEVFDHTNYDFNMTVVPGRRLGLVFSYNGRIYRRESVEKLQAGLALLSAQVVADPDKRIGSLTVVGAAERQVLLEEFTRTDCGYPAGETVDGLFREQALVRGSSVAVTDGVRSWSYGELDRESDLLAGYLVGECGVRRGEVVGLLLSRGGSYVVSVLSVLKAGGVWLPLDPEHPSGRLEGVLSDAGAVAVVSDSEHLYRVPGYGGRLVALDVEWPQIAAGGGWREAVSGPQDGAYVLYTSGSTGRPKGVLVRHGSLLNTQRWRRDFYGFDQSYVTLQVASFGFDSSVNDIFSMLLWGGRVVVAGERDRLDAERLGELVAEHGVTNFNMVPGLYRGVLEGLSGSGGSLRVITLAGEKLSGGLVREHFRRSPGVTLVNEYGPTENAICSTALRIAGPLAGDPGIGRPVSNTRVYILDRELGLLPVGVVGEICLSGAGLSEGYIGSAALGEERFVAHPYEGSGLLYRTGDLGRWTPSGEVEYVGRLDDQVKIRGQRVEPGEVGSVLESAPGVSAAVVVAEGQEEKSLCGYVVLSSGGDLSAVEAYAAGHLPEYMRPRWYVVLESLPLTVNGKVDRSRLVRPQEEPAGWGPEQAARGPLEELVCGIWAGVLGRERVGAQEDFFRIGGDSIKAIQIASRLYRSGYKAGVKDIFEHPSVRELSGVLVLSDRRIDQSAVSGRVELTPIQRYFFGRSLPVPGHYNQSVMLFRAEGFERAMVESVFGYLVGHHDALRLVFRERGGVWEQYNRGLGEGVGVSVTEYDLRSEGSGEWPLSVSRLGGELQAGLDLSGGPLVKVGLFHRPGGDELLVVIHHLVVDTVSWRILLEDLEELLGQWESGQPLGLGDKTDSYRSWSEALLSYGSGAAQSERSYWSGVCAGWPAGLPKDHPGGANRLDTMEQVGFRLSAEQTRQLLEESHGAFHTEINDLLLAGLGLGLSRQYGVDRVGLWLEGHGRQELGLELSTGRTVGWFTSMYPVLLPVGGGTLSRCIREVKESLHGVPHKGIGYGSLRYGPGGSSLEALREISFNYLGQFDSDTANKRFGISEVSGGPERPGSEEREFALEVSGMVTGGCLRMWISYSREQYSRAGMERLSELYAESLGEVIGYCSSRRTAELTPSDLSYKGLTIDQLEKLSGRYGLQDVYPLTPMQEGLLFHSLYDRGSSAYFEQVSYRLEGELSPELVERSLQALFDRHEVLRTAFVHEGLDRPLQVLLRERSADFRYEDLRAEPVRERQERVSSYKEADRRRSFDLGGEALLRVCLFRLGEREYEFIWSHHHIIMDGWCVVVLTEEYFEIYASLREGRAARLGAVRRYRDYIMWLERQGRESAGAYWRAYLSGYGVSAVVPYREPYGESAGEYESIRSSYALSEELSEGLRELAASRGVTLNTVVQALWAILLGKYNGLEDVVFGSVVSGRPAELPEVESMIGLFINTIPVRIRYTGDMGFGTLLARMQQEALSSSAHQYYPLASIQSESGLSQQLLDHFLVFTNYPVAEQIEGLQGAEGSGESSGAADWEISGAEVFDHTNYDFNMTVVPGRRLGLVFSYNGRIYRRESVEKLQAGLALLSAQVVADPDKRIGSLTVVGAAERQVLLEEFTRTDCGYPAGETVDGLFREQALVRGSSVAVTDGVRSWSYGELDRESDLLAGYLVGECGVRRGEVVGLLLSRGGSYVVSVLSVLKAGGVWLPLDPEHPSGRLEGVLSDAGAVAVVSDSEHLYRVPGYGGRLVALDVEWPQIAAGGGWREAVSGPQDGAYVLYTSGSTGRPKGVLVRHGSLLNTQRWRRDFYGFDQSYVTLQVASFGFDSSVNDIFSMLLWGGRVVVAGERDRLDAERLGELVAEHGVTNFNMVPGLYRGVLEGLSGSGGSLRVITLAGEKLSGGLVREHFRRSPGVTLVNEYGPTENAICSTALRIAGPLAGDPGIGRPVSNTRVYILDRELGLLPVGVVGEICLSGAGLSEGYIGSAALGEERFVAHPYEGSGLLYRTGDLGRWTPSGEVEYVGRLDDQVKIRGQRVEPGEVGSVLESAPGVSAAVVVAEGQEEKSLCGYVVLSSGGDLSAVEAYAAGHLPEYMRPRWYVVLESLPLTVNGKVDRSRLVRPQEEPAGWGPEQAARGPLEELVCGIWAGVLGRERVGAQEDFFRIGGDSIKAIQIASRLYRSGYKAGVKDIFEHPSVRELSGVLVLSDRRIDQSAVSGRVELTPIQRYFFGRSLPVPGHYNQSVMLFRAEGFERAMVESVFGYLVGHHDALRLVFRERGGVWEQYNRGLGEGVGVSVTEYDLRSEGSGEWPLSVSRLGGELQAGLDLSGGPLVKVGLFHRPGGDELLVVIHHLVVDTVSWRILLEDLEELLGQWESGQPLGLGDKTDSYRSWSEALLSYGSGAAQSERSYWSGVCAGWPAGLPKDHPGGANRLDTMEQVGFRLSAEQTRQLLEESHGAFHTEINDLLLAGLGLGLSRQYGVDRVGLWLEGHGRQELGLELSTGRTVGWFTSMYPVLLPVGGGTLSRCIREVKESLHGVPHKGIGYGSLRYGPGGSSLEALREISFNYLGQFDSDTANKRFGISEVSGGPERPGSEEREFALEVSGMVTGGCLRMWISYSREQYSRAGMERLSELYAESLGEVIGYCSSRRTAELTPSDLSYKGLTIDQLEKLSGRYGLQDVYPLTPMQEGLLFHSLYDRGSSAYFEQVSYRLEGELSPELVERSLQALFDRHEVLRTAFVHEGLDRPLQVLLRERSADFRYEDLRAEPVRERQERVSSYKEADRRRSFDLGGEALLRVCLFRLGEREYEFIWSHHHIIMDGWCVVVLTEEYFEIYASLREGRAARLGAVRRYRDYIMWLERQGRESAGAYWRAYLSGYGVSAVVPYREPYGESAGEYESIRSSYALSEELSEGLRELAASRGVTLNTVVQALWAILLGKYNGLEDVVFGSVVSGRPAELPEVESMIGLFINTIPVRIRYTGDMGFGTLLARMQQEALSSSAHQYYPLASIQSESGLSQQLLDHFLVFTNYPVAEQIEGLQGAEGSGESSGAADWEISGAEVFDHTNYDFNMTVVPGRRLGLVFSYNGRIYRRESVEKLQAGLALLSAQVVADPDKRIGSLTVVGAAERQVLLEEFTRTDCGYPAGETVDGLFREQALVRGSSVAVTDGVRSWSYGELDRESDLLAGYLVGECGVRRGEVVGLLLSRGGSYVVSVLSVLKAGGVWLPLDPEHPSGRLEGVLSDAGAVAVVSDSEHLYRVPGYGGRLVALDVEWPQIAAGPGWREAVSGPQDGAYVLYTSGSTGRPKGVLVRHGSLLNTQRWRRDFYGFDQSYVTLQVASFGFDSSVNDIFSMLLWGGRVVVAGERDRLDAERLGELVAEHGVTNFNMVPGLYRGVLEGLSGSGGSLRVITLAGEKLSGGLVREHFRRSPGVTLVNEYGPTENAICSTALRIAGPLAGDPGIGRPVSNTRVYILDRELGLLPVGVVGEICLSGAGLSEGYIGSAALGEERFVAHPYEGSGLLYRTGDLGRWTPSGEVEYVGRLDDQVKIRGQRVEPGEVGSVLESAPGVSAAVVVAEGQEEKSLCGYVVLSSGGDLSAVEAYAAGHLPEYMRPRWYVVLESLPLTVNGKVDRSRLVRPQEEPAGWGPEQAARGPLEELVCGIWAGVLGRERVGAQEDFFRIGGDSIKAIQIASRLYRSGYKAGVKDIFEHPSVRELSGVLVLSDRRIDQSAVSGRVELTPIQRYFFGRSLPVPGHYNQSVMLFRAEGFERAMVESVFGYLVGHHDALRLVFRERGGVWEQYNRGLGEGVGVSVTEYDLRSEGSGEWPLSVSRLGGELQAGLDLSGGPLVKVGLFHRPGGDELLVVIHHLVVDTVSWRILLEDLEELLGQWESGQPLGLGDKTDSYRSWSEALLSYGSGAAQSERSYWSGVCAGWPAGLPKDNPGGANRLDTMEQVGFRLSAEQTRQLLEESHGAFHTEINDLLLAGLGLGLSRQYGVDRVGLWLEGHGRQELGLELSTGRTVGWFTSMYPVLLPVGGGTLSRCIREVKESLHGVPHKGIGYGSLRYGPGGSSLEALREISFNYLGQFDSDTANKRFGISEVSGGPERPGSEEREFALEVSGMVTGGCLRMWISYSREQYSRAGMERLSELYAESLGEVIGYCSSRRTAELTPSDLSYKGLAIDQLETFFE